MIDIFTQSLICSKIWEWIVTRENHQALIHLRRHVQYYYATCAFSCISWPGLLIQFDMHPHQIHNPWKSCYGFSRQKRWNVHYWFGFSFVCKAAKKQFQGPILSLTTIPSPPVHWWCGSLKLVSFSLWIYFCHCMLLSGCQLYPRRWTDAFPLFLTKDPFFIVGVPQWRSFCFLIAVLHFASLSSCSCGRY